MSFYRVRDVVRQSLYAPDSVAETARTRYSNVSPAVPGFALPVGQLYEVVVLGTFDVVPLVELFPLPSEIRTQYHGDDDPARY